MSKSNTRIGLCLSGGGARGIAHIGVIKALLEQNLHPEVVSGTSAGAIIGTLYAAGKQPEEMEEFVRSASFIRAILPSWPNKGLVSLAYLKKHLIKHLNIDTFEGLKRPMYIAMSKLNSGKTVIKHEGPLYDPIMASCAIPLVFKPVTIENETYVDGGLLMNLPASVIREQCDILIGVNLNPYLPIAETKLNSARNIVERCFDLTINNNTKAEADLCDLLIEPAEILDYHIFQFQKTTDLIELGYQAGLKALEGFQLK